MDTLPKFTPGEGHNEGSLVQKFDREVPVNFKDQYFQLMFTDAMVQIFVIRTNSFARNNNKERWYDLTAVEFKTFLSICLYLGVVRFPSKMDAWSEENFYGSE